MGALVFEERSSCITCGSPRSSIVWSGSYSDAAVQEYMDRYGYAVAWREELQGNTIALAVCSDCQTMYHLAILDQASLEQLYSVWIDENQIDTLTDDPDMRSGPVAQFHAASSYVRHLIRLNRLLTPTFDGDGDGDGDGPPWRILDFGCGDASFLKQARLFGFETWGVDVSMTRATQALDNGVTTIRSLDDYRGLAPRPLHAITLFQVLEHLDEPRTILRELANLLATEGVLIVEVPDCSDIAEPTTFEQFRNVHPLEHINAFTPKTLTAIVEASGFTRINPGPSHVTDQPKALLRSELTRFYEPKRTNQYFRKT